MFLLLRILFLSMFLVGCEMNSLNRSKQDMACHEYGGVYGYVNSSFDTVTCVNGSKQEWKSLILTPEFYPNKS